MAGKAPAAMFGGGGGPSSGPGCAGGPAGSTGAGPSSFAGPPPVSLAGSGKWKKLCSETAAAKYGAYTRIRVLGRGTMGRAVLLQAPSGQDLVVAKEIIVEGLGARRPAGTAPTSDPHASIPAL